MFEGMGVSATSVPGVGVAGLDAAGVTAWVRALAGETKGAASDAERIEEIRALEELKCAAAARQAELTADFDVSQRAAQAAAGVHPDRRGRGVALQVALARRESHHRGRQHLGLAVVVPVELPCTWAGFRAGRISEWRVQLLARETACLSRADRGRVDRVLAGDLEQLEGYGDGELVAAARKLAYRLDPESVLERRRRAERDRRVTCRPAPDVMSHLSALLPVAQGVAVFASLTREADRLRAVGDSRSKGQIMADTLVERVTGIGAAPGGAGAANPGGGGSPVMPVTVNVVISDRALLAGADDAAWVEGYGPIPAGVARDLVRDADQAARAALRRLYATPETGALVGVESDSRFFPQGLSRYVGLRDQTCRTKWCDAPIRHRDHVEAVDEGGPTTAANGQGLCAACNIAKEAPGWQARPRAGPRHTVETTTPTGHRYRSTAPRSVSPAPGWFVTRISLADLGRAS